MASYTIWDTSMLNIACDLLKNENIVSIPTETVYGLAGSIYSEIALKKIFSIKNTSLN